MADVIAEHRQNPIKPLDQGERGRASPQRRFRLLLVFLVGLLLLSLTVTVTIGPVAVPTKTVGQIVLKHTLAIDVQGWSRAQEQIIWLIRFPRVLLAGLVGAGLSVVGVTMQAMFRNPLADPYVLGISSGASVGATLVLLLGLGQLFGLYALSVAAFLGALTSFAAVFLLARGAGKIPPNRLILSGVAIAYLGTAFTSLLVFRSPDDGIRAVLFWLLGSLAGARWGSLLLPALTVAAGVSYLITFSRQMNALLVGEETAITLGVDPERCRTRLLVVTALLTGILVAVSGAIGFMGLMMPHIVRLIVGVNHQRVLPASALLGAIFLVWIDVVARVIVAPEELPISIITSVLGAPFFLWLMHHREKNLSVKGRL